MNHMNSNDYDITEDFLNKLLRSISLASIMERHLKLIKTGSFQYKALCPFHNEKTPSLSISDDKGLYYCFGCGAKGNVINFLQEYSGHNFIESVEILAQAANIVIPQRPKIISQAQRQQYEEQKARKSQKEILYEINAKTCNFFQQQLKQANNANNSLEYQASKYLADRGFTLPDIDKFQIGFAKQTFDNLKDFLLSQKYNTEILKQTGLFAHKPEKQSDFNNYYDRFRGRIIFPIIDEKQRVIAFGARTITDEKPKYLNSPASIIFDKSSCFYGLNIAYKEILKTKLAIIAEGYTDVITMQKFGILNVVAPLGTSITMQHLQFLKSRANKIIIAMDSDQPGRIAALRTAEMALALIDENFTITFCLLENAKDPDEYIKKFSIHKFRDVLLQSTPLSQFLWQAYAANYNPKIPEEKTSLEKLLLHQKLGLIKDEVAKKNFKEFFREKLWWFGKNRKKSGETAIGLATKTISKTDTSPADTSNGISGGLSGGRMRASVSNITLASGEHSNWQNGNNHANNLEAEILYLIALFPEILDDAKIEEEIMQLEIKPQNNIDDADEADAGADVGADATDIGNNKKSDSGAIYQEKMLDIKEKLLNEEILPDIELQFLQEYAINGSNFAKHWANSKHLENIEAKNNQVKQIINYFLLLLKIKHKTPQDSEITEIMIKEAKDIYNNILTL